jgi:peptide deformylase
MKTGRHPADFTARMMQIIQYPHPTLRYKSKPLKRLDAEVRGWIDEMFELMYQAKGIGLAANQVDLPYRLFVTNPAGDRAEKAQELVFINPVISGRKGMEETEEGCLSLPGLYAPVKRPEKVAITAYNMSGQLVKMELDDLLARVVQHETDHLDGVLFIDRLGLTHKAAVREALEDFEVEFRQRQSVGEIPDEAAIAARIAELEAARC